MVGWLSFLNGQRAVQDLSSQLRAELTARIQQELKAYLDNSHSINQLNVDAFTQGELNVDTLNAPRFFHQTKVSPLTYSIYCAGEDGQFLGTTRSPEDGSFMLMTNNASTDQILRFYGLDKLGNRTQLLQTLSNYDPRTRPWYKAAVTVKRPVWSDIYLDFVVLLPTLTASQPVYDSSSRLIGVCATDVLLTDDLRKFLAGLSIGKTGEAFVIDRSGAVVSSSTDEPLTVGEGEAATLLQATESSNTVIRGT
ncbi:MAG: hypothetical protein HC881_10405, partial [Leptolyngbyaceae cyanobacterium SL_7_1]|nr:hypothetical protein [Leptolyngbyaceae cyanobacterium SL_7_1]